MYCISDQQIAFILNDISARGVKKEDLQLNLLDHICCIIEHNLEEKGDFECFYYATIKTFYRQGLQEIEEETNLLLTFKNYYAMKKIMLYSGLLSTIAMLAGCFLKITHSPGAGISFFIGIIVLCFIFLPLLLALKLKEVKANRDRFILIIGVSLGILYFISMLFKVMSWPGANVIWISTLALSFFVFMPAYFFTGIRRPELRINTIVSSIILIAAMGVQFTLTVLQNPPQVKEKTPTVSEKK